MIKSCPGRNIWNTAIEASAEESSDKFGSLDVYDDPATIVCIGMMAADFKNDGKNT